MAFVAQWCSGLHPKLKVKKGSWFGRSGSFLCGVCSPPAPAGIRDAVIFQSASAQLC